MSKNIKSVCAWCGREIHKDKLSGTVSMGGQVPDHKHNPNVSHSICPECRKEMMGNHRSFGEWVKTKEGKV